MFRILVLVALLGSPVVARAQPTDASRPETFDPELRLDVAALTAEQWREDLRFLAEKIRTVHPNPFRFSSTETFEAEVARLDAAIPNRTPPEILAGMLRVVALAHDGHTRMQIGFPGLGGGVTGILKLDRLPVRFYVFNDALAIVAAAPPWERLAGTRVMAIGRTNANDAIEIARSFVPADNELAAIDRIPRLLEIPQIVAAMGLSEGSDRVTLTVARNGSIDTVRLPAIPPPAEWIDARPAAGLPLFVRHPERAYWSEWLPDGSLYVHFDVVLNREDETIEAFFGRLFEEAKSRGSKRMILDMRFNTGGNNSLNWPIIYGLIRSDALNRRGRLFVLIGRRTFSAAQNGVNWLERHTEAVFVGEPTGATPNHYGDAIRFVTPNAGLPFFVSTLYWQNHPRDDRSWTPPDIFAPPTHDAYLTGTDPALKAIDDWDPRSVFDRLVERLETDGVDGAIETYAAFRSDPRNRFVDVEADLNRLGYVLMRQDHIEDARRVFQLVVETHPESANAHDSLGEALWKSGETERAIREYRRAIELDPDGFVGRHARSMLEEIREERSP